MTQTVMAPERRMSSSAIDPITLDDTSDERGIHPWHGAQAQDLHMDRQLLLEEFRDLDKWLDQIGCIFSYRGVMYPSAVVEMGEVLRSNLISADVANKLIKIIFAMFVESAQNILKYSAQRVSSDDGESHGFGAISIFRKPGIFMIQTGNMVSRESANQLNATLLKISSMSAEELQAYHREKKFLGPALEPNESAGLGLIEMARKASQPLQWMVTPVSDNMAYFTLQVTIEH